MSIEHTASTGLVAFLFAIFTAYWAQTTHRNPWLWFLFGFVVPPLAGLVLLWKNGNAHAPPPRLNDRGREDLLAVHKDTRSRWICSVSRLNTATGRWAAISSASAPTARLAGCRCWCPPTASR
jgi:hypothetical protein